MYVVNASLCSKPYSVSISYLVCLTLPLHLLTSLPEEPIGDSRRVLYTNGMTVVRFVTCHSPWNIPCTLVGP